MQRQIRDGVRFGPSLPHCFAIQFCWGEKDTPVLNLKKCVKGWILFGENALVLHTKALYEKPTMSLYGGLSFGGIQNQSHPYDKIKHIISRSIATEN